MVALRRLSSLHPAVCTRRRTGRLRRARAFWNPLPVLTNVLLYHVAPGDLDVIDFLVAGITRTPVTTLLPGATFQPSGLKIIDNEPNLKNPRVMWPLNVPAANGRIHTVDRVLIPLHLP